MYIRDLLTNLYVPEDIPLQYSKVINDIGTSKSRALDRYGVVPFLKKKSVHVSNHLEYLLFTISWYVISLVLIIFLTCLIPCARNSAVSMSRYIGLSEHTE